MSHVQTMEFAVDMESDAAKTAIAQVGATDLGQGEFKLYSNTKVTGHAVSLPGWNYPVVFTPDNKIKYDNYNGSWGKQELLDNLCAEIAIQEAIARATPIGAIAGTPVTNADGSRYIDFIMQTANGSTASNTIN